MREFDLYFSKKYSIYQYGEIGYSGFKVYFNNNNNDLKFDELENKCLINKSQTTEKVKKISDKQLNKYKDANKIIIKTGDEKIGTIKDSDTINEFISVVSSSFQSGNNFLLDMYAFTFELYNNNKYIDSIYMWYDGARIMPKSLGKVGYYLLEDYNVLRKMIENNSETMFYGPVAFDNCEGNPTKIYSDKSGDYYLGCDDINEVFVDFQIENKRMTLKYALENNYVLASKFSKDFPYILTKK